VDVEGRKHALGVWIAEAEGAKFWHSVLTQPESTPRPTLESAELEFKNLDSEFGAQYPGVIDVWRRAWPGAQCRSHSANTKYTINRAGSSRLRCSRVSVVATTWSTSSGGNALLSPPTDTRSGNHPGGQRPADPSCATTRSCQQVIARPDNCAAGVS